MIKNNFPFFRFPALSINKIFEKLSTFLSPKHVSIVGRLKIESKHEIVNFGRGIFLSPTSVK